MSVYRAIVGGERHVFDSLAALLAAASYPKTGDELAGLIAESDEKRICARFALADLPLRAFIAEAIIPYELDDVTRFLLDTHDEDAFSTIASLTCGEFREWLLSDKVGPADIAAVAPGLTPEMVAAVSKLMRNRDLITVSRKCVVTTSFRSTIGLPGRMATRLQPNHPTDDIAGIVASTLDGLKMGSGDAVIGVNPVSDNLDACYEILSVLDDLRTHYAIPTQTCVLTHVTNSLQLIARGAPTDLIFQSIAGSQAANRSYGISLDLLREAEDAVNGLKRGTVGSNAMYFETGQGSALSASAHHGVDQQTMETRAYGIARAFSPLLVNTVVGFIGPEYIDGSSQIIRAGLEDHFCGKLLGLPMGCDICYTNHSSLSQNDMDSLSTLLGVAGVAFVIAVPGADDVMLNYQSLSFHDALYLRDVLGLRPAPEFESWLREQRIAVPGAGAPLRDGGAAGPLASQRERHYRYAG